MRLGTKIICGIVLFSFVITGALSAYFVFVAKVILTEELEGRVGKKVSIHFLHILPPFRIAISGLEIPGVFKAEEILLTPSIISLFAGRISFNTIEIIRPEFTYERFLPEVKEGGQNNVQGQELISATHFTATHFQPSFLLKFSSKHFSVKEGTIIFIDRTVPEGVRIVVKNVSLTASNFYTLPRPAVTRFSLNGTIPWADGKEMGGLSFGGWIDLVKGDMDAKVELEGIDGVALWPYYADWVDVNKVGIQKATLNFTSHIKGVDHAVTAACHFELADIVRQQPVSGGKVDKVERFTNAMLNILSSLDQDKIVLDFTLKTNMNHPLLDFSDIQMTFAPKGQRKKSVLLPEKVLSLPIRLLQGLNRGAREMNRTVVFGTVNAGKEIFRFMRTCPFSH
jgi:hypothetical protein